MPASSAYSMAQSTFLAASLVRSSLATTRTKSSRTALSMEKRSNATVITATKKRLNKSGAITQPWRRPCSTANHSDVSPLSRRTHACMPSWNWRMIEISLAGTPYRASTFQRRERSNKSYAFCRSMKHMNSGRSFSRASSWIPRTT